MSANHATMTINEFRDWARISRTRTYELIRTGKLAAITAGRRTLIRSEAAQAWLDSLLSMRPAGER